MLIFVVAIVINLFPVFFKPTPGAAEQRREHAYHWRAFLEARDALPNPPAYCHFDTPRPNEPNHISGICFLKDGTTEEVDVVYPRRRKWGAW